MGVSLSSDLILDVMRNADPGRLSGATAKLHSLASPSATSGVFADMLGEVKLAPDDRALAVPRTDLDTGARLDAYVDFERMVLRNLLDSLLPDARSGAFGSGPSAGVWRSLAADQLAGIYAEAGGIGIAATIASEQDRTAAERRAQWPYFTSGEIKAFTG